MRLKLRLRFTALAMLLAPALCSGAVVDRVAVVIDKKVITEGEVLDELRLTAFLNEQPLDLTAASRRAAAERLVDQELILRDMESGGSNQPSAAEAGELLRNFRQQRFQSLPAYRAALQQYGITEEQLKKGLAWQLAAIRFTDVRFRVAAGSDSQTPAGTVDEQMDAWLKQTRESTRILFRPEAFQ